MIKEIFGWFARHILLIISAICFLSVIAAGIKYYSNVKRHPDSFAATIYATILGVLCAAAISYVLWSGQQWQQQRTERNRLTINLIDEIRDNRTRLNELIDYLEQLEKWALTLEDPNVKSKDFMICNDPEKGEHLKEIFPYRQASFAIEQAVSQGTLILMTEQLQDRIRQLAYNYWELNHRIDYCEKSSSDLVYTTILVGALHPITHEGRKSLIIYQARSIVRFLRNPAKDLLRLTDETLGLLAKKEIKEVSKKINFSGSLAYNESMKPT